MKPSLPQVDSNPERRQTYLQRQRSIYRSSYDYLPPIAYAEAVPVGDSFSVSYQAQQFRAINKILLNMASATVGNLFDFFDSLDDYEKLFLGSPLLSKPSTTESFLLDAEFARQRIAGANPMVIERVDAKQLAALVVRFPLTDELFQQVVDATESLEAAAAQGKLYLTDYTLLAGSKPGRYKHWQKYSTAPLALFYWQTTGYSDRGALVPVAIQLQPQTGPQVPIFTRLDEPHWSIAKTCVQSADFNHHELISHLARTHLLIAPFILATARQLSVNHPLQILLAPHFQFTLAINDFARFSLINPGGFVDKIFAGTLQASLSLVSQSLQVIDFKDLALPIDLKRRGVDDDRALPDYPYRDDGLLLWNATHQFVDSYLGLYYNGDLDIQADYELQQWVEELVSDQGGRVRGLTENNQVKTLETLVDLITQVIFTCGPQHGAVNFPQYDYEAFAPNMPAAIYAIPPTEKSAQAQMQPGQWAIPEPTANFLRFISPHLLKYLPPKRSAVYQIQLTYFLTAFRYSRYGYYERDAFEDPRARAVIKSFQQQLSLIENRIDIRNTKRLVPYPFLKPSLIPNSINI